MVDKKIMGIQGETVFGQYQLGLFYSETFTGEVFNPFDPLSSLTGVAKDNIQETLQLVILLHETAHYVHDLSLGACLNNDFILDESAAITFQLLYDLTSKQKTVCPLSPIKGASEVYGRGSNRR
jgi:hypothetical protein